MAYYILRFKYAGTGRMNPLHSTQATSVIVSARDDAHLKELIESYSESKSRDRMSFIGYESYEGGSMATSGTR